ncbi:MAG: hypothetical protein JSU01_17265 [Bacteroidetes bacterium]|nr:hypothetical protein [Bacteroidota bacterium]
MKFPKPAAVVVMLLSFSTSVKAQLWSYINVTPESEKAAELRIEREASSVKEVPIIVYGDTLSYTLTTYDLQSFDGKLYNVAVSQKPFTKRLNISCGNDSLVFIDVMGMDSVHFLNKNFLEILYSPRGGSDLGLQNTVVICIEKGKLHVAMEIESAAQSAGPDEWSEYYSTAELKGNDETDYQFLIKTNDRYHSDKHPKKNHNLNAKFGVKYDSERKIFYNTYRDVNAVVGDWEVPGFKTKTKTKLTYMKGHYPAIVLGDEEYYYIKGCWYSARKWFDGKIHLDSDLD